jgi:NAD(P)-dependent dehydrogenase (short-subunit alcohol dehydrogenase family)
VALSISPRGLTRVAITAACGGIGLAIARAFQAHRAAVHVCDIDLVAVEAAVGEGLVATEVDVADGEALDDWLDGAIAALGGLDVLVNNAGIAGPTALVEDVEPSEWERCLAVGLTSHYRACARVAPTMKAAHHGSIINISSTSGLFGVGMRTPYAAAKWAVIGLTKSLAVELGPYNVRVNAVCPGVVEGARMSAVIAREAAARGLSVEEVERETVQAQSIARYVKPEEVAALCLFLASDEASVVSGQAIAVDGHTETYHIA